MSNPTAAAEEGARNNKMTTTASEETAALSSSATASLPPVIGTEIDEETVYDFYTKKLFPAIWASLPLLLHRLGADVWDLLAVSSSKTRHFLLPGWSTPEWLERSSIFETIEHAASDTTDFMLRHFDTNGDGHISPSELLNMTDILSQHRSSTSSIWNSSNNSKWSTMMMMDWNVGLYLWRSCSGLLLVICLLSLLPGRLHGILGRLLRWPVLGLTYFLIAVELSVYIVIRLFIRLIETTVAHGKHRLLRRQMRTASSYTEWYDYASQLDESQGRAAWRRATNNTSNRFNWDLVTELIQDLRKARGANDAFLALAVLQQCTRKNVGGIMSEESFSLTNTGEPKWIVEEFVEEVATTLQWVTGRCKEQDQQQQQPSSSLQEYNQKLHKKVQTEKKKLHQNLISWATLRFDGDNNANNKTHDDDSKPRALSRSNSDTGTSVIHKVKLISFLKRARAAYGRTALCLSGGAMMGLYHFGHVKALLELDLLPNIISGTSAGSVVAAIVCTRTPDELARDLDPTVLSTKIKCFHISWSQRLRNLYQTGCMFEYAYWKKLIQWMTMGDMTFEEAFKKTGRVFCITLSATTKKAPPVLLNHISAPNVVIASAVIASAAVPGLIDPVRLEIKAADGTISYQGEQTYWDGSIESDIPTSGLAEMLNCQFFIAAQCNPHIVPFFYNCRGGVGRPTRWSSSSSSNNNKSSSSSTNNKNTTTEQDDAWRGGFLLSALELYLKNDMKAKFQFLHDIEAALGFTGTMMIQQFVGSTTIVPQVSFIDYTQLMSDPSYSDLIRYEQGGMIAAYEHCAMIRLHYRVADAIEECLRELEQQQGTTTATTPVRRSLRGRGRVSSSGVEATALRMNSALSSSDDSMTASSTNSSTVADYYEEEDAFESTQHYVDVQKEP